MQSPSAVAFTGSIAWTLALLVLMELLRTRLVVLGKSAPNEFRPDNANLSRVMQRLARAHANCAESLPVLGNPIVAGASMSRSSSFKATASPPLSSGIWWKEIGL